MESEFSGVSGLSGRYATALFELADDAKALDAVAADLTALRVLIEESADLRRLIRSPVISRDDQMRAMDAILERMEVNELTRKFVGLVAAKRRLFALAEMIRDYLAILAARRGQLTARVTSAEPLSDLQMRRIKDALAQVTGSEVAIDARVDPALLGGLVVRLGSRMVDSSLSTKLQQLQLALKGAA